MTEIVRGPEDLKAIKRRILASANDAALAFRAAANVDGVSFLRRMKFERCGHHPLTGEPHNLVEQINLTFTCLVTLAAAAELYRLHPQVGSIRLNMGTAAGSDIEDVARAVFAAEVFAATHHESNDKLAKDLAKVAAVDVPHRYVFFATPAFPQTARRPVFDAQGVQVWSVALDALDASALGEPPGEMEILTAWALRFDGYRIEAERGFVLAANAERFVDTGVAPDDRLERLAILFALQRWLGKWGGEYETLNGRTWRRFSEMFLRTHAYAVPAEFRMAGYFDDWIACWWPRVDADVETVWRVHATTAYDDDARPTLG